MKRYVVELRKLYTELLKDAAYVYPALKAEFERDLARLTLLSNSRGLSFFMTDLPNLGKHLDRCLALGQYSASGLPVSKPISRSVKIPVLYRGLYLLIFDRNGSLKEHADVQAILVLRQLLYGAKKAEIECPQHATDREIRSFVEVDVELPIPTHSWEEPSDEGLIEEHRGFMPSDELRESVCSRFGNLRGLDMLRRLDLVSHIVSTTLGVYNPLEWNFKHGPGSVSDVSQSENRYRFENWSDRLEQVYPSSDVAHHDYLSWVRYLRRGNRSSNEPYSRLIAVQKTLTKPRLIASEPSEHMFCQQNIRHFMYDRVAKSWIGKFITFRDQQPNRDAAIRGSMDDSLATIDLSAASDRVSTVVVGNLFRDNLSLLRALAATRTHLCQLPNQELIKLRKYSTMGNATTFPVQSLVFLSIALSCCIEGEVTRENILKFAGKVSVFGDDIIVPSEKSRLVMEFLESLYFKVNADKSYLAGPFRESCGVDAFRGHDVTPAYWHGPTDKSPESIASSIEVANNFYKKFFVYASAYIESTVARKLRFPYRCVGSGAFGFDSFCAPSIGFPVRWGEELQREECRVPVLSTKTKTVKQDDDTSLLQYFTEDPSPLDPWEAGVRLRPLLKIRKRWVPTAQFSRTEL